MGRSRTIVLFGLAALVGAACGTAPSPDVGAPTTTAAPAQSVERGLVGTWQGRGCSDNGDDELLEATCLTLELDASHTYALTAQSDYLESDLAGKWGVIAVDDVMGQLHLENHAVAPFRLRGEQLEYFGEPMVKVQAATSERNSEAFVTSFATLDELFGYTWYRLGGPLATTQAMAELTVEANGTYNVAFDSGCESSGDLWGYREESSPAVSYTRTESVLWLMEGCESSFGDARMVNVALLDGHLFLNGAAFGLREDHSTNHALGPPTDGVSLHASYAPPTAAGQRTVLDLRVVNDRSDSIEVSSIDVNTTSLVANGKDDEYSTSTRSPDTTSTIERTVPSGERHDFAVEVSMPDGAGAIVTAFVRFVANGHDKTVSVSVNPLFAP